MDAITMDSITMNAPTMEATTLLLSRYRELSGISMEKGERLTIESLPEYKDLIKYLYSLINNYSPRKPLHRAELQAHAVEYVKICDSVKPNKFEKEISGLLEKFASSRAPSLNENLEEVKVILSHRLGLMELATRYKNYAGLKFPVCSDPNINPSILFGNIQTLCNGSTYTPEIARRATNISCRLETIRNLLNGSKHPARRLFEKAPFGPGREYHRPLDYLALAFCFHPCENVNVALAHHVFRVSDRVPAFGQALSIEEIARRINSLFELQSMQIAVRSQQINIQSLDTKFMALANAHMQRRFPRQLLPSAPQQPVLPVPEQQTMHFPPVATAPQQQNILALSPKSQQQQQRYPSL